ncbi:hypothetical protein [Nocardia jejuensis]|uniref:hypothetical protein n=1 Tax=Nocardia jejuensis TaxID=328049 RepID=UPI000B121EFD|nr:hypothetical protein [Nocardia jejuensis]
MSTTHRPSGPVKTLAGLTSLLIGAAMATGTADADPNIQLPGWDDGLPNCAVLNVNAFAGYIGTGDPQPTRPIDEHFTTAPAADWCTTNVGYSTTTYGADGVTMINPPTLEGVFPYNNSEILPKPIFEPGQTMTMDIKGAPDLTSHNGTAGWGVSNRAIDPLGLELAWFMYNGSHGLVGAASELTRPIFNVLGQELPRGFFLMVKRGGELIPQIQPLDPALLSGDHAYAVRLDDDHVNFFIDGSPRRHLPEPTPRPGRQHPAEARPPHGTTLARRQLLVPPSHSRVQRPRAAPDHDPLPAGSE